MGLSGAEKTALVRKEALKLGFDAVGISKALPLLVETPRLSDWLEEGRHGDMHYLANHFEKRVDPAKLVPGTKSVISLCFNYFTEKKQSDPEAPVISIYAYGRDYHKVLKKKLGILLNLLRDHAGVVAGRAFVDSAPVMERPLAAGSGLGWIGKNTLLIHPKRGSYFFLAELFVDIELEYDTPMADHCGTCRKCIEACPTEAIDIEGYKLDAKKCISYATIEKKGPIPDTFSGKMVNRVFGCDICQSVCPWNTKFATPHREEAFEPKGKMLDLSADDWTQMTENQYEELFNGTPVRRAKFKGLRRNIDFLEP